MSDFDDAEDHEILGVKFRSSLKVHNAVWASLLEDPTYREFAVVHEQLANGTFEVHEPTAHDSLLALARRKVALMAKLAPIVDGLVRALS